MAKREIVELTDDIDVSSIADGAGETIDFSVNGIDYRIDPEEKNSR
ncbi:Lsr2 dimerization domain-containing protein [Rhodococcus sp. NBC_00297]